MASYNIFLADDHAILRQGVKRFIEESEDMVVTGEAGDGMELLGLLKKSIPDLIILDISMPNLRGIEAISEIKAANPEVKILILTMHKRKEYLYHALSAGAEGYMLKEDTDHELFFAIETIRRGGVYISPQLSREVTDVFLSIRRGGIKPFEDILTLRERQVLKLIAEGKSNKEIGDLLFISVRTVHHHRASVMNKLGLKKVADLVKYAIRHGYTSAAC
jgi:DNA-binding NarL/FixJ family response regulator